MCVEVQERELCKQKSVGLPDHEMKFFRYPLKKLWNISTSGL